MDFIMNEPGNFCKSTAFLLIKTDALSVHKDYLLRAGFSNKFTSATIPEGILYLEDGTIGDYTVTSKTAYGHEVTTTTPKLVKAVNDTLAPEAFTSANNASLRFHADDFMAQIVDLYIL